jgi:hypothetical protein
MAKFTLFLVHGIGIHRDASWADETTQMLSKAWQRDIEINSQSADMEDHIEVVPISYDSVFEDYLDDFADLGKAVFDDAIDLTKQEREQLSATIKAHKINDRHFIWSYIVDVILYKMAIVREQVNVVVARQLYERISSGSTNQSYGIIAHSLGTRVINDTLQRLRTEQVDQSNFYKQGYRLKFLMQISDVTDLFGLPFGKDRIPPNKVYPQDTYDYFRTVTNRFDPIARIIPTCIDHWPQGRSAEQYMGRDIYRDILLDHVHEHNVHGLTHYMLHPQVTDEIFELCGYGRYLKTSAERHQNFPIVGPSVEPSLRDALMSFMSSAIQQVDNSWQTYVNLVIKFGEFSSSQKDISNYS